MNPARALQDRTKQHRVEGSNITCREVIETELERPGDPVSDREAASESVPETENENGYYGAMKATRYNGVSGPMSFTDDGLVTKAEYRIVNFVNPGQWR